MEKREQMYEGKAKKVFKTDDPRYVIVDYKDDATAFNGEKKGQIAGKGVVNNTMSNIIFQLQLYTIDGRSAIHERLYRHDSYCGAQLRQARHKQKEIRK